MRASIPFAINRIAHHTTITLAKAFMRIITDAQARCECDQRKILPRPIGCFPSQLDVWIPSKENYHTRMSSRDASPGKTLEVDT